MKNLTTMIESVNNATTTTQDLIDLMYSADSLVNMHIDSLLYGMQLECSTMWTDDENYSDGSVVVGVNHECASECGYAVQGNYTKQEIVEFITQCFERSQVEKRELIPVNAYKKLLEAEYNEVYPDANYVGVRVEKDRTGYYLSVHVQGEDGMEWQENEIRMPQR